MVLFSIFNESFLSNSITVVALKQGFLPRYTIPKDIQPFCFGCFSTHHLFCKGSLSSNLHYCYLGFRNYDFGYTSVSFLSKHLCRYAFLETLCAICNGIIYSLILQKRLK